MKRNYTAADHAIFRMARARYGTTPAPSDPEALDLELRTRRRVIEDAAVEPSYTLPEGSTRRREREYNEFWRREERRLGIYDDRGEATAKQQNDEIEALLFDPERHALDEVLSLWPEGRL
jgi:hypothetical protein